MVVERFQNTHIKILLLKKNSFIYIFFLFALETPPYSSLLLFLPIHVLLCHVERMVLVALLPGLFSYGLASSDQYCSLAGTSFRENVWA